MVKKLLSGLITISIILSQLVTPALAEDTDINVVTKFPTTNLIVNGGFEDGFDGWTVSNPYNLMSVTDTFVDDAGEIKTAVNGNKTFYVSTPANSEQENVSIGYVEQEIDAAANTNYVLNLSWYDAYSSYGSIKVYGDTVSAETCLATVGNLFSGNGWYSSTCPFNSGEHEKLILRMEFVYRSGATKYAIDNITLKAAGNTQTISFENGYPEDLNIRGTGYAVTTEKAYDGEHSIKLTSGTSYLLANAAFALNPDRHYSVMFWYYIESGTLGASLKFAHENSWSGYTASHIRNQTLSATGVWTRAIMTPGDSVSGTLGNKFVELAFQNMSPNTVVYIDNIQCKYYDESVDSITITGENILGGILHSEVEAYNYGYSFKDPVTCQWQRSSDKKIWNDIAGATDEDYRLTSLDSEKYLRLKVNTSNRYSEAVSDAYYSKAIQIEEIAYSHQAGTSYGISLQNETFIVEDGNNSASFDCVNDTADELDFSVFVGAYSYDGEIINYSVESFTDVPAGGDVSVNASFAENGIGYLRVIVFDDNMKVYYADGIENLVTDDAENSVDIDQDTRIVTVKGENSGNPEIVIFKDGLGTIKYITVIDCEDNAGYQTTVTIDADAYGEYYVYTSHFTSGETVVYYSPSDCSRVLGYFDGELDSAKVIEAYEVLGADNDLLDAVDAEELTTIVNSNKAEVTGETFEEKKANAKIFLEKMLVLEAYNQNLSGITKADGKIRYEDELGLAEIDAAGTTFYNLYNSDISVAGLNTLNTMLCENDFAGYDDFERKFKESVILCAIAYPTVDGSDYIERIITTANMDSMGIDYSVYITRTESQKDRIHADMEDVIFADLSELEAEINKFLDAPSDVNTGVTFRKGNLIVNGGFENGLDGWVIGSGNVFTIVENTFTNKDGSTFNVSNDTKALKATSSETDKSGYIYQEVAVNKNTNYVLNLSWFHFAAAKGGVKIYGDAMTEDNLLATVGGLFGGEVWYSSICPFNSGKYEKVIIRIDFSYADAGFYYCVDNITLKAAGNTQSINFESGYAEDIYLRTNLYKVTTEKAYEGEHSIKLTSGNSYSLASTVFALNPNRKYAVTFWYYLESGSLGYALKHAHEDGWAKYNNEALSSATLRTTGKWEKVVVTPDEIADSGEHNYVELAFQNMAPDTVVYIDNIQCVYYNESVESITITGNNESGGTLYADVEAYNYGYDIDDEIEYQWQRSEDNLTWVDIVGATSSDYRLTRADSRLYLRLKVSTTNINDPDISDVFYTEPMLVNTITYKHKKGTSYGVQMQNDSFSVEDNSAQAVFDLVNKTADEVDLNVYLAVYSESGELMKYSVDNFAAVAPEGIININKSYTDAGINNFMVIVYDNNMNVYYSEKIEKLGADSTANAVNFDKETQKITVTGINANKPELVMVKDEDGTIRYITVIDCEDKAGYKTATSVDANAYGKYFVYTSYCNPYTVVYYSPTDYERIVNSFGREMDKEKLLEAYHALEIESDLFNKVDKDKLVTLANSIGTEVTGDNFDAKRESAVAVLEKMLVLEAYNENLTGLTGADGKILYRDELELDKLDSSTTNFVELYDTFIERQGLDKINKLLVGKNFKNSDDFNAQFKEAVILSAIAYPSVYGAGYIAEILTNDNMSSAGIDYSVYDTRSQSQKNKINEALVRVEFDSIEALEAELNKALQTPPTGGGGGGGGGSPSTKNESDVPLNLDAILSQNQGAGVNADGKVMNFTDINDSHWAYKYVYALKEVGIINGLDDKHFAPDNLVTREQFVKMLCDAFGLSVSKENDSISFADCEKDAWYEYYIKTAVSQGIVSGIGEGLFGVGKPITREDLCVMAARALNSSAEYEDANFVDSDQISDYAKSAVSALTAMKVISGFEDGTVRAKECCTRAQAAKIIYELRAIKEIQQ